VNPQWRPNKKLILDAGLRLQVSPARLGLQSYELTTLASGTAVYNFIPNWHIKLNYAQGFRPPVFNNTNSNGEAVQIDGRSDLKVETSDAVQAEVNARIFKGKRRIRELSFRADYAYTRLQNTIQIIAGRYQNTADRGIHTAEALAKLYIVGGHRLELAYTFMRMNTADKGIHKSMPEHMFHLGGVWNLVNDRVTLATDLRVVGAMEDPNRIVEHRGYREAGPDDMYPLGTILTPQGTPSPAGIKSATSDLVLDRLPPVADLSIALTYTPTEKLVVRGSFLNVLNARYYHPDAFFDYEPRLEFLPNPAEDWRAYLSASYLY
jgi:outer membrane receptor protein involved in Fe transport